MDLVRCALCGAEWEQEPEPWNPRTTHDSLQTVKEPWVTRRVCLEGCAKCRKVQRELAWQKICPALYQETDPARLPLKPQFEQVMGWEYGPRGLLLIGDTALGKSRCAWWLLKHLFIEKNIKPTVFDCISFAHECSRRFRGDTPDGEAWIDTVSTAPLVYFDDLGKLKLTERAEMELFGVIERRCANKLPIICTTNDTGDTLAARMTDNRGPAMIRRLREFCHVIRFSLTPE